jgi:hypothetical protein
MLLWQWFDNFLTVTLPVLTNKNKKWKVGL